MDISLLSKLINHEPTYFDENEMVDSNNLYTYGDVAKLILKFFNRDMNAYKIASKDGVSSFVLNNKDITLKICVSPYTCKVYSVNSVDNEVELPNIDIEKCWQRILIKRNGQSYFNKLEQYYKSKIEQIREETKNDLERFNNDPRTKEYDVEVVKTVIKQKKSVSQFKQNILTTNLSDLRRYLHTLNMAREAKKGV